MSRPRNDLPRMQKQSPVRAPLEQPTAAAIQVLEKPAQTKKPLRMMRQYDLIERVRRYNPNTNEALLNRAYVYAMKAHGEQRRASGDPYFSHPIEVAAILTDLKLDDATIAAALLHDTIEDTAATRAEIDSLFGPDIGRLVEGLTKLKKLDLVTRKPSRPRTCASSCWRSPTTCACCWSSSPTACTTCARSTTCRRNRAAASPTRRWKSMRRSPPHGHA